MDGYVAFPFRADLFFAAWFTLARVLAFEGSPNESSLSPSEDELSCAAASREAFCAAARRVGFVIASDCAELMRRRS